MFKTLLTTMALSLSLSLTTGAAFAEGDVKAGKKVFKKCKACHTVKPGKNKVGPSLHGILGKAAGSVEGFKYSDAMAGSGLTWDEETFTTFMKDPKGTVPGSKMVFRGLKKDKDIVNLIAYLVDEAAE